MFDENLDVFFNSGDFATVATLTNGTLTGIFEIEPVEENDFISNKPTFLIKYADVSKVTRGANITINSTSYTVSNIVREDEQLSKLILNAT